MKVHHGGPSCLDLGKESGLTAILHPSHRAKPSGTGLCPLKQGFLVHHIDVTHGQMTTLGNSVIISCLQLKKLNLRGATNLSTQVVQDESGTEAGVSQNLKFTFSLLPVVGSKVEFSSL